MIFINNKDVYEKHPKVRGAKRNEELEELNKSRDELAKDELKDIIKDWKAGNFDQDLESKNEVDDEVYREEKLDEYEVFIKNDDGEKTARINNVRLARLLMEGDERHYIVLEDTETIYFFNGSYWEPNGKQILEQRINYFLDEYTTIHKKKEVISFIRNHNYVTREQFQPKEHLINLKNGVFNLKEKKLYPHSPQHFFLGEIPVNYDHEAKLKQIKDFFETTLNKDDISILQEFIGDCLQPTYKYKKALMLVGPTDTGKSQLLNLLTKFLGHSNVSHESLFDLCHDKFSSIELYGKLANVCADIDATGIRATKVFLMVTGGDYISGQKKHQDRFKFRSYAKLVFSCNKIPESKNTNPAYYNRWLVFECNNQIDKEERIPFFFEKISTEEELSGLLNWALEGLERLQENGCYSEHRSIEEVSTFMKDHGNPLAEFANNHIKPEPNAEITKKELYQYYLEFCNFFNFPKKADNVFSRMIKKYLPTGYDEGQSRIHNREKVWRGFVCTWKKEENKDEKQQVLTNE